MIARIGILQKKADLTQEQYENHWLNVHGPLAKAKIPGLNRYYINTIINSEQLGVDYPRAGITVDGFSQLYFDDLRTMQYGMTVNGPELQADTKLFTEDAKMLVTMPHIVIEPAKDKKLLKRMSIIRKRDDVSYEKFQREWMEVHPLFVNKMPGIAGYRQSLVLDRLSFGKSVDNNEVPVDGIVELWFEDLSHLEKAFGSESGAKSVAHAKTILDQVSTFLVEEHTIV